MRPPVVAGVALIGRGFFASRVRLMGAVRAVKAREKGRRTENKGPRGRCRASGAAAKAVDVINANSALSTSKRKSPALK